MKRKSGDGRLGDLKKNKYINKKSSVKSKAQTRGRSSVEEGRAECKARKRSGIEATKGVRRIGSREKDW